MTNELLGDYDPFYYDRANTLGDLIRIMDNTCRSFKGEGDGIRVALVTEYVKNGLCRYMEDARVLLDCEVEPDMIVQIVEEAIEYAKSRTGITQDKGNPLENIDMEDEKARLHEELKDMVLRCSLANFEEKNQATEPGQEAR